MRLQRHVERRVHVAQVFASRQASVPCKAPAQARLPRVARNLAANTRCDDQALQHNCASLIDERLVEELKDWHQCRRIENVVKVVETEEHGNRVKPGGHEANGHGTHDGNRNHLLWARDFLSHMRGAVEACKRPVGIDQTDDKRYAARSPAGVVDKGRKDELGILVRGSFGWDDNQDHEERNQGGIERHRCDGRKDFAVAVEEKGKGIDDLIANKNVPRLDDASESISISL